MDQNTEIPKIEEELAKEQEEDIDKAPLSLGLKIVAFAFLCLASLGLVLYGVLAFTSSLNSMKYKSVEAVIRDKYTKDKVYVLDYKVDDKEYSSYIRITKDVKVKDKITVYYNPKDKEEIVLKKSINIIAIFVAIVGLYLFKFSITKTFGYFKEAKVYFKEEDME